MILSYRRMGKRLFFISDRALDGKGDKKDIDIWYIERTKSGLV